jgi:hypothetical protein
MIKIKQGNLCIQILICNLYSRLFLGVPDPDQDPDPNQYFCQTDPDPGGPKTYGSGTGTLHCRYGN